MAITVVEGSQPESVYFFERKGTPQTKVAATIDGVKFYRPTIEHVEAFHSLAEPLPQ